MHFEVKEREAGGGKLESMVGPVLPRVTSSEGLSQDEHHIEKPRWQPQARSTPHYSRQQQVKHYHGGDPVKRIGQRGTKGADHRLGEAPDVTRRINLPSSACSSGRSNLDRFLEETTPCVKAQTLPKVFVCQFRETIGIFYEVSLVSLYFESVIAHIRMDSVNFHLSQS